MTLLYIAVAYLCGIALGRSAWVLGWLDCEFPTWLWWIPLLLLPLSPLCNRLSPLQPRSEMLRWPVAAGFEMPRSGPSPALFAALGLALVVGLLRYAAQPLTPCWSPTDLAYHNLPADRAFDRTAPEVTIKGYISSYPLVADTKQRLQVEAESIIPRAKSTVDAAFLPVAGTLRLTTGIHQRYQYGQPVLLRGRLATPPDFEDFSYREYLARKQIHSLLYNAWIEPLPGPMQGRWLEHKLYALRARGEVLLNRLLPEPHAALANGMLLGIEAGIPDELYEQFNLTGTSHTIVISGSNISLLAAVLLALGQKLFGRRRSLWPTLIGIGCYALLVGGDAAVLRAAFMGALFVTATAIDRQSTALVSLAVACWVMTLINPLTLWDVGFQLSSAATAGLILFTPGITAYVDRLWPASPGGILTASATTSTSQSSAQSSSQLTPQAFTRTFGTLCYGLVQDGLLVTVAANVTTLPLVIYYFERLSVVSLLSNVLIAPVQPFIMLWGSLGILVGVVGFVWVAKLILLIPWLSLAWTVFAVRWSAAIPGASLQIDQFGKGWLLITYLFIALVYWRQPIQRQLQAWRFEMKNKWHTVFLHSVVRASVVRASVVRASSVGLLSVGVILLWSALLTRPDGRLHLYFLNIGQGDGIFIQTPSGRQVLVDGGTSPQTLLSELGAVMPFWDRSIDLLVLSHPDGDHMNAQLEIPARFQVETAINTAIAQAHPDNERWQSAMGRAGVEVQRQAQGGWIDLGDGVALWILWPPPTGFVTKDMDNENSLVIKLVYGDFTLLLTGDAGRPSEMEWLRTAQPLAATVLKVGHHGSTTATDAAFLAQVDPQIAIIQSGAGNSYGHPNQETLETLAGRLILRNDRHGRIHLWSDGKQLWLETEEQMSDLQSGQRK